MKSTLIKIVISILIGLLAVYLFQRFIVVDSCLDLGGSINESGLCIYKNGLEQYIVISSVLLSIYFTIGIIISLVCAYILGKLVNTAKD